MLGLTCPKELALIGVRGNVKAGPRDHSRQPDINNIADLATKLSNILPTFLRDFLSPDGKDTLILNDLEEKFVFFFQLLAFFLGPN